LEILALKMIVTEQDLNEAAARYVPDDEEIRKIRVRVSPEGVHVTGIYHLMINVSFETRWEPAVAEGLLTIRLVEFKAMGMPAMIFQGMLMKMIREAVETEAAIVIEKDTIRVDIDRLLGSRGLPLRTHLSNLGCQAGQLTVETLCPQAK
jgi:hypothetical protein